MHTHPRATKTVTNNSEQPTADNTKPSNTMQQTVFAILNSFLQQGSSELSWRHIYLDGFVSPDRSFRYTCIYTDERTMKKRPIRLNFNASQALRAAFVCLYELGLATPLLKWNKARFSYTASGQAHIHYYFDPDLDWLERLDPNSRDYLQLPIEYELAIQSWEGLATDISRPWLGSSYCPNAAIATTTEHKHQLN